MSKSKITALEVLKRAFPDVSREKLMAEIVMGDWSFSGHKETNPKALFKKNISFEKRISFCPYVSRGGLKLESALKAFSLFPLVENSIILDAGSSTGGFTDCLLQEGASLIYACDVGSNQLHWKLRENNKVRVYEKTNIMDIPNLSLDPQPNWAVADIAFRSSVSVAKVILPILKDHWMLVLIKPQFEWLDAPKDYKGVVPLEFYEPILSKVGERFKERDIYIKGIFPSELKGKKQGNQEFFFWVTDISDDYPPFLSLLKDSLEKANILV